MHKGGRNSSSLVQDRSCRYLCPSPGFYTHSLASNWPEGLLVGNGSVGAIVMGRPQQECLMVSHEELFLPLFERLPVLNMAPMLPKLRALLAAGCGHEANRLVVEAARTAGYPSDFLMTDPFHPGIDLLLDFGRCSEVQDYRRGVDFERAEAFVRYVSQIGGEVLRRCFVSRADDVLVLEARFDEPSALSIRLGVRPQKMEPWEVGRTSAGAIPKGAFVQHGVRSTDINASGEYLTFRGAYTSTTGGWEAVARVLTEDGKLEVAGNGLMVMEATQVLVVLKIQPTNNFPISRVDELRARINGLPPSYDGLIARHAPLHAELTNRVRLALGDESAVGEESVDDARDLPVEEYLKRSAAGAPDPAWIKKAFDACRYIVISSSGVLPPNLQGVWTGTWTPHWSGDYTLDANVQAAVAHYLPAGTPELMESLFRLMDRMMDDFRENARTLYGARGFFVNTRVSTHGLQQRYNYCPVVFWTAGAAWLAHYYYDYYRYTLDRDFLRTRAIPFMREALEFYADFLVDGNDGRLCFNPSFSPENTPANGDSIATINATMDVASVRELATNYILACGQADVSDPLCDEWQSRLKQLPDYLPNNDGALKEWCTARLEDNYEHRHMSHLYPLYPGDEADAETSPHLFEMCRRALQMRMRHYNPREYSAFGLYHLAMAAARSRDPDTALDALCHLTTNHIYSGMSTSHDPGPSIFNVDAAGGIPAAILEMLIVSRDERIELLPAAVGPLEKGRVEGVRCRGGITVERMEWDLPNATVRLALRSKTARGVEVVAPENMVLMPAREAEAGRAADPHRRLYVELDGQHAVELIGSEVMKRRVPK